MGPFGWRWGQLPGGWGANLIDYNDRRKRAGRSPNGEREARIPQNAPVNRVSAALRERDLRVTPQRPVVDILDLKQEWSRSGWEGLAGS